MVLHRGGLARRVAANTTRFPRTSAARIGLPRPTDGQPRLNVSVSPFCCSLSLSIPLASPHLSCCVVTRGFIYRRPAPDICSDERLGHGWLSPGGLSRGHGSGELEQHAGVQSSHVRNYPCMCRYLRVADGGNATRCGGGLPSLDIGRLGVSNATTM